MITSNLLGTQYSQMTVVSPISSSYSVFHAFMSFSLTNSLYFGHKNEILETRLAFHHENKLVVQTGNLGSFWHYPRMPNTNYPCANDGIYRWIARYSRQVIGGMVLEYALKSKGNILTEISSMKYTIRVTIEIKNKTISSGAWASRSTFPGPQFYL